MRGEPDIWWKYYSRWVKTAFTHSLGLIDLWTGTAGAVVGILDHYWPQAQLMASYGWQIPLWALGMVVAARLLLAPFWMAKEDAQEVSDLRKATESADRRLFLKEKLGEALEQGNKLMAECKTTEDRDSLERRMNEHLTNTLRVIQSSVGDGEAVLFNSGNGITQYSSGETNEDLKLGIGWRMHRLVQILQRIDTTPIRPDFRIQDRG